MSLLDILLMILVIVAIVLCIYLIFALRKMGTIVQDMGKDIHNLVSKSEPVLDNWEKITSDAAEITEKAKEQLNDINDIYLSLKSRLNWLTEKKEAGKNPENRIYTLVESLSAVSKGLSAFWNTYKKNK
ncbi:MAG: hypothetical protein K9H48_14205 [Melioribacteraceae bacterium]|nr:hypothetical protein [Melioribacteraceae bacterium]MCF8395104.1 hypothetical protein [Melioribacteraceae bacterium]MCF8420513.1 hypothetical protein [Melioribacteraceae bacterium]